MEKFLSNVGYNFFGPGNSSSIELMLRRTLVLKVVIIQQLPSTLLFYNLSLSVAHLSGGLSYY